MSLMMSKRRSARVRKAKMNMAKESESKSVPAVKEDMPTKQSQPAKKARVRKAKKNLGKH